MLTNFNPSDKHMALITLLPFYIPKNLKIAIMKRKINLCIHGKKWECFPAQLSQGQRLVKRHILSRVTEGCMELCGQTQESQNQADLRWMGWVGNG